jgi:hypothetical protein
VTPEVTRDVCLLARMMAANLYYSQIEDLMFEVFSLWKYFVVASLFMERPFLTSYLLLLSC